MYKIIGADQREYGPVTADQIRQWVAEGRANAATLIQGEGRTDWAPLSSYPEFSDLLTSPASPLPAPEMIGTPTTPSDPDALAAYIRARGYSIDIGQCVGRSWALLKANLGVLILATVVFAVLAVIVTQLLGLLTGPAMRSLAEGNVSPGPILVVMLVNIPEIGLSTVLSAGIYVILLKLIRGQPTSLGDLFAGFTLAFVQLAAVGIVVQILSMIGFLLCIIPGIYLSVSWIFAIPLVFDRGLDFWAAMELSRKVVTQNWWQVFALIVVAALINVAGFLACCVGLLITFPLGLGALLYAYEDIFGGPGPAAG